MIDDTPGNPLISTGVLFQSMRVNLASIELSTTYGSPRRRLDADVSLLKSDGPVLDAAVEDAGTDLISLG